MKTPLAVLLLSFAFIADVSAQAPALVKNIFPEGSFDVAGDTKNTAAGWSFPDIRDKPWANGFRAEVVTGESGSRELRIIRPSPENATIVGARVPVPAKAERLKISYRILAKSIVLGEPDPAGNGAGVYARFYDAEKKPVRGAGWVGGSTSKATDAEWAERDSVFVVPEGAVDLELHIIFRSASGEIRIDDVKAEPLAPVK